MGSKPKKENVILCVDEDMTHLPDSTLVECHKCGKKLWLHSDIGAKPVCLRCVVKIIDEAKENGEEFRVELVDHESAKKLVKEEE